MGSSRAWQPAAVSRLCFALATLACVVDSQVATGDWVMVAGFDAELAVLKPWFRKPGEGPGGVSAGLQGRHGRRARTIPHVRSCWRISGAAASMARPAGSPPRLSRMRCVPLHDLPVRSQAGAPTPTPPSALPHTPHTLGSLPMPALQTPLTRHPSWQSARGPCATLACAAGAPASAPPCAPWWQARQAKHTR